ncbi:MAG: hypothetical protein JWR21_2387 [Herminiimonas sp.]|nr:hypothetical protein [Herminiimonas sp.]
MLFTRPGRAVFGAGKRHCRLSRTLQQKLRHTVDSVAPMKTRSDVKWLVNEAAALAGELCRIDDETERLASRRAAVEKAHKACVRTLSVVTGVAPCPTLPTVHVHRSYGRRGNLRQLLRDALKAAAPATVDSDELAFLAIDRFQLTFSSPEELQRFKNNTVGRALRHMDRQGTVEPVDAKRGGASACGNWRWRGVPSMGELRKLSGSATTDREG